MHGELISTVSCFYDAMSVHRDYIFPRNNAKYKQKTKARAALQLGIMGALAGTIIHI